MTDKQRTIQQNKALHLFFILLADDLNSAGYDIKKTLRNDIDIPWTPILVKELIWRKVQDAYLGKKSTTKLKTDEVSKVYDVINRYMGEKFGIDTQFPSIEELMRQENNN